MRLIPVLLIVLLAGPAEAKTPWQHSASWPDSLAAAYAAPGRAEVSGQVFARTQGGAVMIGAGCEVQLMPDTPYFREWIDRMIAKGDCPDDPRLEAATRKALADASGNFYFPGLPPQRFIAWTVFRWRGLTGRYQMTTYGGVFVGFADCSNDSAATVHLASIR